MRKKRNASFGGSVRTRKGQLRVCSMDPILLNIIRKSAEEKDYGVPSPDNIGEFTNRIIMSKRDDVRYSLRMIFLRLNNEFDLVH